MSGNHILHYAPGAEGYGTWRLECVPGTPHHGIFIERTAGTAPCRCIEAGNDCRYCAEDDHGGCGYFGSYITDIGYECQCEYDPDRCWTIDWFDEYGAECIHGDDWPEDGPWPCHAGGSDGLELTYAAPEVTE